MARELKNHPGYYLANAAADAFDAYEAKYGKFVLNSARRTPAQQQHLINRWDAGGTYNRPPYLYAPARPAELSNHVKNDGVAVDIGDWRRFQEHMSEFGFHKPVPSDVVHFEHRGGGKRAGYQDGTVELGRFQSKLIQVGQDLAPWGADKKYGAKTKAATLNVQRAAEANRYPGGNVADDGLPGPSTEAYLDWLIAGRPSPKPPAPAPAPRPPAPRPSGNPFGISSVEGLQKIAKLYGYKGAIDNDWGSGSAAGFAQFLRRNHGYKGNDTLGPVMWKAIARWLRGRWGYKGNDVPGPVMRAALTKAEAANEREL